MREIKFRAWDGTGSIMFSDVHKRIDFCEILHIPDHFTVMQYTGLKDKNGKEIYEGDIQDYGNGRIVVVEFKDGCFGLRMPNGDFEKTWVRPDQFKVIGNVYENPELINK